jgi:hypothetical protein
LNLEVPDIPPKIILLAEKREERLYFPVSKLILMLPEYQQ